MNRVQQTSLAVLLAAATTALPAHAQSGGLVYDSHLLPERSPYSGYWDTYEPARVATFKDVFANSVEARYIANPSNRPDYAIGIVHNADGSYRLLALTVDEARDERSTQAAKIPPVTSCRTQLDTALAERLVALWRKILLETRFPGPGEGAGGANDGTTYHFSTGNQQNLSGQIADPSPESKTGALVSLADTLHRHCSRMISLQNVIEQTAALEKRLQ